MSKLKNLLFILLVIAIPIIIYFYFLQWKTTTMYGDDLYIYKTHAALNSFSEKINIPGLFQKYRPVHGFSLHLLTETFQKNVDGYYFFNIAIQAINTFLFALILNLFLKSPALSIICSLPVGLSRFSYFNVTQLYNGGALEGLAITFFLVFLFYIMRAIVMDTDAVRKQGDLVRAMLFANLCMYTHERYIVLLPFILLLILFYPGLKILSRKQKMILTGVAIASICLNVFLKKVIYHMPFFVGTGGTNIEFSTSAPAAFFTNGFLSIIGINKGPEYLAGIKFSGLPVIDKVLMVILLIGFLITFFTYFWQIRKPGTLKQSTRAEQFWLLPFLAMLFVALLIPAVVTIRLVQRWLQASYCVFILSFIIAFSHILFKTTYSRNSLLVLFIALLLWCDFTYLNKGAGSIYLTSSEAMADEFGEAIDKGIIRPGTKRLYIWEKHQDVNAENAIKWVLAEGYFFNFYKQQEKNIFFADSIYQKTPPYSNSFVNFNKNADQIIYMDSSIVDITNDYLQDSLKTFNTDKIDDPASSNKIQYNQTQLRITNDDFNKFITIGFYDNENGIRWTNGNASIGFIGNYMIMDTLNIELNTFMPPICKNINPKVLITDYSNKVYRAGLTKRQGDKFIFRFHFEKLTHIQKINILSDTIDALPDVRMLSFPFISLELKKIMN